VVFPEIRNNPKEWGRVVESAVGTHLVNQSISAGYNLYYWRDRNDEVDFVLERHGEIVAIEVKSTPVQPPKGMDAFIKNFKPNRVYLIDNKNLSWEEFLQINPLELF
jgi:predicted AAA+ superfamily ATPase